MDIQKVAEAIEPLRAGFQADGVELRVDEATDERVKISILLTDEACKDCLLPTPLLQEIFHSAIRDAGLGRPNVEVEEVEATD